MTLHPLKEEELNSHYTVNYKPEAVYSYTAGQALSKFLLGLKDGKILGRKCPKCGRVYVPPRMYCEKCFVENVDYVEVANPYLDAFTVVYYDNEGRKLDKPVTLGLVRFEETVGGLLAYVEGEPRLGGRVEIVAYDIPLRVRVK
ncbi:MAG: Zn-ribbon domain-containing OB-fold protein [Candidatus Aramenus sp.]|jgi:uncharacterized OB-fold protein|nr:Zn-ribbon domain-containing OB-fold protein [Candidatus Aramenus sp.]